MASPHRSLVTTSNRSSTSSLALASSVRPNASSVAIRCSSGNRAMARVEHLDRLAPHLRLGRIDLAQIQNVPLHHSAIVETLVLDEAPIEVRLAVLPSLDSPQEHDGAC